MCSAWVQNIDDSCERWGGDNASAVNVAANAGTNAAENNYLAHSEAIARAALKDKQAKDILSPAEQRQLTNLEVLDIARDMAFRNAYKEQGDACNAARRDLNAAIASYAAAGGNNNTRLSAVGNQSVTAERNQSIALSNDPMLAQQTLWDMVNPVAVVEDSCVCIVFGQPKSAYATNPI